VGGDSVKFSVVTDMFGKESFSEALKDAKELGFDFVELRAKLDGNTIDTITVEKAKELGRKVKEHGLKVATLSSWAINTCTFSGPPKYDNYDENHHKAMIKELERLFNLADAFDAPNIRIYSLYRRPDFDLSSDEDQEAEFKHNAEVLRGHAEYAKERGKVLLVENEPPTLANNCVELGKLVKFAKHPNLKLNWDIVNGWRSGEYPTVEKYKHIKGNVASVHLKGASREVNSISKDTPNGRFNNFAIAGQDDFEHRDILNALLKGDPEAIWTIDTHYPSFYQQDKIGEFEAVKRSKEFFKSVISMNP
jgi:3-dehydroshikimate dehydratase